MTDKIQVTLNDGVALLLINRPECYNAMDGDVIEGLARHFTRFSKDDAVQAVVIGGAGRAFSSGADLKSVAMSPDGITPTIYRLAAVLHQAIVEVRQTPKPYIAAINGVAAGAGFSLALACDFRVMAESAVLRQVYTSNGLCIDGGGTFALPRLVGIARALEIAAFDPPIPAARALEWGMATRLAPDGQAVEAAMELARDLLARSLHAFGKAKQLIARSLETPLEVQLEHERQSITACVEHPDAAEGVCAFMEKRKPVFNQKRTS